jgi:hypothetical protein
MVYVVVEVNGEIWMLKNAGNKDNSHEWQVAECALHLRRSRRGGRCWPGTPRKCRGVRRVPPGTSIGSIQLPRRVSKDGKIQPYRVRLSQGTPEHSSQAQ